MKRIRLLSITATVLAAALLTSACAGSSSVATVDGEPIELSDVTSLRHSFGDAVTLDSEAFRQDLTPLIYLHAQIHAADEDFGLTDLDSDERVDEMVANPSAEEQAIFAQVMSNPDRTEAVLRVIATQLLVREQVSEQLLMSDPDFLTDLYENDRNSITSVCARHILTLTREEIDDARARVVAGEDFSAVADDVSIDTQSEGGSLPCPSLSATYVEPFGSTSATAPIGEVTEPFQTEFGWHILIVDERATPASVDELLADPLAYVDSSVVGDLWGPWLDDAVARADIEISSQVGTWFAEGDGILPPS